jgi:tetratricopeptide (TPR) repeat protein
MTHPRRLTAHASSMPRRSALRTVGLMLCAGLASAAHAQSVQYRSPAGVSYRALSDTARVVEARTALEAEPTSTTKRIALATAHAGSRQFREAIATLTAGLARTPGDVMLLRWRGHRYISVREFAKARADLTRGFALDSTNYGILFHLGVLNFIEGDFRGAAEMFTRAQPLAPDGGERAGSTDWLWMSLSRDGRRAAADAMLARRPDTLPAPPGYAYVSRLRLYRGEVTPATLFTPSDTADVQVATLNFGLGNWLLVQGDTIAARAAFERAIASGGWPGFGFIAAEAELARRGSRSRQR